MNSGNPGQHRVAAHLSWANTKDRAARASAGYAGLLARFEREARTRLGDTASDKDIAAAAESLRKAHFTGLAETRRKKAS